MGDKSGIEWTDATWNPIRGCTRVGPECDRCYAIREAHRSSGPGGAYEGLTRRVPVSAHAPYGLDWSGTVRKVDDKLLTPIQWQKPRRIFVASMSDPWHHGFTDADVDDLFAVMWLANWHRYQALTKRADRALAYMTTPGRRERVLAAIDRLLEREDATRALRKVVEAFRANLELEAWPPKHVAIGVSVGTVKAAEQRLPALVQTPAAARFVSFEPLLEDVADVARPYLASGAIHWGIPGGESGAGARPLELRWVRRLLELGEAYGVPMFVKQLGARPVDEYSRSSDLFPVLKHSKGGDPAEWPKDLRVREFPVGF